MSRAEAVMPEPLGSCVDGAGSFPAGAAARPGALGRAEAPWTQAEQARLREMFDQHFSFVWRYVRRLGLRDSDADDATQQIFLVLARRVAEVAPGKERSFLCGTAVRVVSEFRRAAARRHEVAAADQPEPADGALRADDLLDRERARAWLDQVLEAMPWELRTAFVLYELEELSVGEIAELLELPAGTAASRLRRARESFRAIVNRWRARGALPGEAL